MKKVNKQIGFALFAIKTQQFAIFEENYIAKKEAGLATQLQFKIDQNNMHVGAFLNFEFTQGKKIFMKLVVSCHFKIEDNSWLTFINKKEAKLVIPKDFLAHLTMITTGTARGILFAKTESTPFSKFIIPILNVTDMIKENAAFEIKKE